GAAEGRLEGARCRREVGTAGKANDIGVTRRVRRDAHAFFAAAAAEVGRVQQGRAARVQLADEGILDAVECGLKRARGSREVRTLGRAGDIGVPRRVQRDARAFVDAVAADEGRVDQGRTGQIQLGDKGVIDANEGRLEGARGGWEVGTAGG